MLFQSHLACAGLTVTFSSCSCIADPSEGSSVNHQSEVSALSGQVNRPYPAGYGFPSPFGRRLSLPLTSFVRWGFVPSLRLAYRRPPDPIGFTVFYRSETRPG